MQNIEIPLPANCGDVAAAVDEAVAAAGLRVTLRGSLKKFPGCAHWHVKSGREPGTLEITYWPRERRAWFTVQDGRAAEWIAAKMALLGMLIRQRLDNAEAERTETTSP